MECEPTFVEGEDVEWRRLIWCICRFDQARHKAGQTHGKFYRSCRGKSGIEFRTQLFLALNEDSSFWEVKCQLKSLLNLVRYALTQAS